MMEYIAGWEVYEFDGEYWVVDEYGDYIGDGPVPSREEAEAVIGKERQGVLERIGDRK
jgi:hypothetical protein